jgi:hypothetical protein
MYFRRELQLDHCATKNESAVAMLAAEARMATGDSREARMVCLRRCAAAIHDCPETKK